MSKRNPPARWPLPLVVDPPTSICYQIPVPNDIYHLAAFKGAIYELAKAYSWGNDDAHTALDVAAVWLDIFNNLEKCAPSGDICFTGAEIGDEMIRQNPDNPCEIQTSADGTTWCTFIDLSLCVTQPGQPGGGSPQPAPNGGQACYNLRMDAFSKVLLPTVINTGDVIDVTTVNGASTDGGSNWYCPDGDIFFGGLCLAATSGLNPADPLPTGPHQSIIALINGVYYSILPGSPLTVPSGIVNKQVEFMINDDTPSDDYGNLSFSVCVTNNQAATWTSLSNFKTGLHGWTLVSGTYVPGSGIQGVYVDPQSQSTVEVALGITAAALTSAVWTAQRPAGSGAANLDRLATSPGGVYGSYHSATGSPVIITETVSRSGVISLDLALNLGTTTSSGLYLEQLVLNGTGTKPPQLP